MGPSLLWFSAFLAVLAVLAGVGHTPRKVPKKNNQLPHLNVKFFFHWKITQPFAVQDKRIYPENSGIEF